MNREDFLKGMNDIDDKYILEAATRKKKSAKKNKTIVFRRIGIAAAAVLAVCIIIPNVSSQAATTLGNLPVLGGLFKTVTLRDYSYSDDKHEANVQVDGLDVKTNDTDETSKNAKKSAGEINKEMSKITDEALEEFKSTIVEKDGVSSENISTETISDGDRYSSIKLTIYESAADSFTTGYFFTIDKKTGERVTWDTLYGKDKSAKFEAISKYIIKQMKSEMKDNEEVEYWIDTDMPEYDFKTITDDTEFYIDNKGNLVVYFPQGDYSPMAMGELTFVIPQDVSGVEK